MICVYKITNTITQKCYIGYTIKGLEARWNNHVACAFKYNASNYLYRSMRKHGIDAFSREVLREYSTEQEAKDAEIETIHHHNTLNSGYNMTSGGTGGNTWINMSDDWWTWFHEHRSKCSTMERNGRWSGYTDDELIAFGVEFAKINNIFYRKGWIRYAKENGYPMYFSKNRFDGSFNTFRRAVLDQCKSLGFDIQSSYQKTKSHKAKLSNATKQWCFITNGIETKKIKITSTTPQDWWRGRTLRKLT